MLQTLPLPEHEEQIAAMCRNEHWCFRYLYHLRWPDNFVCPHCGRASEPRSPAPRITCTHCGRTVSITAGTLLHGTKKPLSVWLQVIWWICTTTDHISTGALRHRLKLNSCQTGWRWMRIIRLIMKLANQKRCTGVVEIDFDFIAFEEDGTNGSHVLAGVEVGSHGQAAGRIRMSQCNTPTPESISQFLDIAIEPGSSIIAPDNSIFHLPPQRDRLYMIEPERPVQEQARRTINCFRAFFAKLPGPKKSAVRLQDYLDEYCFQTNNSRHGDLRGNFEHVLRTMLQTRPERMIGINSDRYRCGEMS